MNANLKVDARSDSAERAHARIGPVGTCRCCVVVSSRPLPLPLSPWLGVPVRAMAWREKRWRGRSPRWPSAHARLDPIVPDDPGVATPTHVGTIINAGRYDITRTEGPIPGRYKVAISSGSVAPTSEPEEDLPGIAKQRETAARDPDPGRHNVATTLQAVVKAGQENTFDFELASK